MDGDEEIVKQDKLQHPTCRYATYLSQACTTKNGEFVCETTKRIDRMCPKEKPVTVFSSSKQHIGDSESRPSSDAIGPFSSYDILKELMKGGMAVPKPRSPPNQPVPKSDDQDKKGAAFSWGGSMFDDDEKPSKRDGDGVSSSLLGKFGLGTQQQPASKPAGNDAKKPPGGKPVGPSEEI